MSWLTDLLSGNKKVWKKIRKAGYKTARGYIAGRLGMVPNEHGMDLEIDDLVRLLSQLRQLQEDLQEINPQAAAQIEQLIKRFLGGVL